MQGCRADAFLLALRLFLGATGSGDEAERRRCNSYKNMLAARRYRTLYQLSSNVNKISIAPTVLVT